jgi:hypothetical protein
MSTIPVILTRFASPTGELVHVNKLIRNLSLTGNEDRKTIPDRKADRTLANILMVHPRQTGLAQGIEWTAEQ